MRTGQFNLRLSKSLLEDLAFIEKLSGLSKTDWVRYKLTELIRQEKDILLCHLEKDFVRGRVSKEEFKRKTGFAPVGVIKGNVRSVVLPEGTYKIRSILEDDLIRISNHKGIFRIKGKKIEIRPSKAKGIVEIGKNILKHLKLKDGESITLHKEGNKIMIKSKEHVYYGY